MSKENRSGPNIYKRTVEKYKDSSVKFKSLGTTSLIGSINVPLWTIIAIEDNSAVEILAANGFLALAISAGVDARKEYKKDLERNPDKLRYSLRKDFSPRYSHDPGYGEPYESPFAVAVTGIHREILGVGQVIGCVLDEERVSEIPVIAVEDHRNRRGVVEFDGLECFWTPIDPAYVEPLVSELGRAFTVPAVYYAQSLRS